MSNDVVLMEIKNKVATITLNQPKKMNALSNEMIESLGHCIKKVKENKAVGAVILTGNGKSFCAGGDLNSFPKGKVSIAAAREYMSFVHPLIIEIKQLEKPVIAAVDGYAVGAGFSLALICDFIYASNEATFSMLFNRVGLVPDLGGLYHLPRIVGMARAKEIVFSGKNISAEKAKEYGIILEIFSRDQLHMKAQEQAEELANNATLANGLAKYLLNRSFENSFEQVLREESLLQAVSFSSEDYQEGVSAFVEKREPNFKGN